ncbi:PREDICTED: uncharacterized protein LOC109163525 [Ipomoea nil]|uniref:uncharacterized protein LOC109163525 n=1 Tax=Ipomoea nil TaxID=35883 RepID=UPI0009009C1B|nr:PREDICTED: uncharacterized protein LOC109163525 [Ipomoea nil]
MHFQKQKIRDLEKPRFFLHIGSDVVLSQHQYMLEVLRKAGMESYKPLATPMSTSVSGIPGDVSLLDDPTSYRQLVGSLMYMLITRPDLSFAVIGYVSSLATTVHAFSNSEWVGCQIDRRSIVGFAIFLGSSLISWMSRKHRTIARSSTKADYKTLANVAAEVAWVQSLLRELGLSLNSV